MAVWFNRLINSTNAACDGREILPVRAAHGDRSDGFPMTVEPSRSSPCDHTGCGFDRISAYMKHPITSTRHMEAGESKSRITTEHKKEVSCEIATNHRSAFLKSVAGLQLNEINDTQTADFKGCTGRPAALRHAHPPAKTVRD